MMKNYKAIVLLGLSLVSLESFGGTGLKDEIDAKRAQIGLVAIKRNTWVDERAAKEAKDLGVVRRASQTDDVVAPPKESKWQRFKRVVRNRGPAAIKKIARGVGLLVAYVVGPVVAPVLAPVLAPLVAIVPS